MQSMIPKTLYYIILLVLLAALNANAQTVPQIQRQKFYGGNPDSIYITEDVATCVDQTSDGGYIVAGSSNSTDGVVTGNHGKDDFWVVKLSKEGNIIWERSIGGSGDDRAKFIKETKDGGYIVAGLTYSLDGDVKGFEQGIFNTVMGTESYWIVKLNKEGGIQWQTLFTGPFVGTTSSINTTKDGGYIIGGYGNIVNHNLNFDFIGGYWIIKLNTKGTIIWKKHIDPSRVTGFVTINSIAETTEGGYVIAGENQYPKLFDWGDYYWIEKLSHKGTILWQKLMCGKENSPAHFIQQTIDGGFITCGTCGDCQNKGRISPMHPCNEIDSGYVVKFSKNGKEEWQDLFDDSLFPEISCVQPTIDRGYVLVTKSGSIFKLNNFGKIIWQLTVDKDIDELNFIKQTRDGGYIVAGRKRFSGVYGEPYYKFCIIKLGGE